MMSAVAKRLNAALTANHCPAQSLSETYQNRGNERTQNEAKLDTASRHAARTHSGGLFPPTRPLAHATQA